MRSQRWSCVLSITAGITILVTLDRLDSNHAYSIEPVVLESITFDTESDAELSPSDLVLPYFVPIERISEKLPETQSVTSEATSVVDVLECPQKLIHRYEGSDWVTNFAVGSFCGGSAASGTESAHCEANSAGVKPPRPLCGRRWL